MKKTDHHKKMHEEKSGWIGVDLDGTLVEYGGDWAPDKIGKPIPSMIARVKEWLAAGIEVRIFTARANEFISKTTVEWWAENTFGKKLVVTATKDYAMIELWDDRAVQVEANTGVVLQELLETMKNNFT